MFNSHGFSLGRYFGIEVRITRSWFILFFLIVWTLGLGYFPTAYPNFSMATHWLLAITTTIILFLSALVHEFAHSLYAKHSGLTIDRITLFLFGGASELKEEPPTPRIEFIMAGLGPLTSLVLAALFWLAGISPLVANMPALQALLLTLAGFNAALGIFNLLPGFPLDGGRMLRAIAWGITKDMMQATRVAATGGRMIAFFLIFIGTLQLLAGNLIGGIWLGAIGLFLLQAAIASVAQTMMRMAIKEMRVADGMSAAPNIVPDNLTVTEFIRDFLPALDQPAFPVISSEDKRCVGIITSEHLEKGIGSMANGQRIADVALIDKQSCLAEDDSMTSALDRLSQYRVSALPVVDKNGKPKGIITMRAIYEIVIKQSSNPKMGGNRTHLKTLVHIIRYSA